MGVAVSEQRVLPPPGTFPPTDSLAPSRDIRELHVSNSLTTFACFPDSMTIVELRLRSARVCLTLSVALAFPLCTEAGRRPQAI